MKTTPLAQCLRAFLALACGILVITSGLLASEQVTGAGTLNVLRKDHTATVLADGRVLILGGLNDAGELASAEIYDPAGRTFSPAGMMSVARVGHTATLLVDGRVLIAGGRNSGSSLSSAEIFDPTTLTFQAVDASMGAARVHHTATMLAGGKVLLAGGDLIGTAELFDPVTQTFSSPLISMIEPRSGQTATILPENSVLLAGGGTRSVEVFDSQTNEFLSWPAMLSEIRTGQSAITTVDTSIYFIGGEPFGTLEKFDLLGTGSTTSLPIGAPSSSATLLANGKVLVTGPVLASLFDPSTNVLSLVDNGAPLQRSGQTLTELPSDKEILVVGGVDANTALVGDAALYNPAKIETDKADYYPDEPVIVYGSGWKPGEDVDLYVVDDLGWMYDSTAVADTNGAFKADPYFVVLMQHLGVTFDLTAVGAESGLQAKHTFSDGQVRFQTSGLPNGISITVAWSYDTPSPTNGSTTFTTPGPVNAFSVNNRNASYTFPATVTSGGITYQFVSGSASNPFNTGNGPTTTTVIGTYKAIPTKLAVTSVTSATYGSTFAVTVVAQDGGGTAQPVSAATAIALTIGSGTGSLGGTVTGTILQGQSSVTISGVSYSKAENDVRIVASRTNGDVLSSGTSSAFAVAARPITVRAVADTKVYDGTASSTGVPTIVTGSLVGSDSANFSQTFDTKNVGSGKTITPSGAVNDGNSGANYAVSFESVSSGNITALGITGSFTVANKVYDGTNATTILTRTLNDVISPDTVTLTGGTATFSDANAGTGKTVTGTGFTLGGANAGNYSLSSVANTTADIQKATATVNVSPYAVTYDGNAHTATGTAKGVLNETLAGLDVSGTTHTNAGTYASDAWTFTDVTGNYNNANGTVSDSIAKANPTISVTPYSVTYNGDPHTATGTAKGVKNEVLNGLDLSATTHTNAGTYASDAWTFTDVTGNYNNANGTVGDSIAKANPTINVTPYSVTYSGDPHTATGTAKGVKGESLSGLDLSATTHTNAGTYASDAWTFTDVTGNYNNANGTVSDSIAKANPTISVTPYSVTYSGDPHTATGTATGVKGEPLNGLDLSATTHTNAGTYASDAWTFTDVTGNYNNANGSVSDSIAKANPTISVTPYSVTYSGDPHAATGTAKGVKGESLSGLDLSATTHTNAGTYTSDAWTFTDVTGNYNDANGTVSDSIAKANPIINVTPYSVTYDGSAHTATGSATGVKGESLAGLDLSATVHTDAGTYASDAWTFTDATGNYNNANGTVSNSIAKANPIINVTPYSVTYNGDPHTATGTANGVKNESLAGLDLSATTHTNAGTYASDAWTFTDITGNYNNTSGTVTDSIAKASATVSVTPYSVTYDGSSHTATGSATGVKGENLSGLDLSGTTHTNAGAYNDSWSFTDSTGNYMDKTGSVADDIAKANATINVSGYSGVYDGLAHGATGTATGVGGADLVAALDLGAKFTNAPGGTAHWTFSGGQNYNNQNGDVAIVINKADATVNVTGYTGTYDAAAHGATGTATGVGGVDLGASLNLGATFTNAPGGTAHWTFSGDPNYNDQSGDVSIVIDKAQATVDVTGYTGTYDGNAHGASGTAKGVGGVDLSAALDLGETFTNAPGGTAHWAFNGGQNYHDQSGDVAIAINKANATVNVIGYTDTYDGNAHGATGTATGVGGADLSASLNLGGTFTNVPGGTAHWMFSGGQNYHDQSGDVAIVINKASATISVTPYAVTYDANAHTAVGTATGVKGESLTGLDLSGTTHTNAATYANDAWSFVDSTGNYNDTSGTVSNSIAKAALKITANDLTKPFGQVLTFAGTEFTAQGLLGTDSVASVTLTSDGAAASALASGSPFDITPSAAIGTGLENYTIQYVKGKLTVSPLSFVGFLDPIGGSVEMGNGGSFASPVRAYKLGSTIPVKFQIFSKGAVVTVGIHTLQATKYSNATTSDPAIDASPTDAATAGNQFRLATNEWHFNLSTKAGFTAGTWLLTAKLADGTTHSVWIAVKK